MEQEILKFNISVALDVDGYYTYSHNDSLEKGRLVTVDFRNREAVGIVQDVITESTTVKNSYSGKIKKITDVLPYKIRDEYILFIEFVSEYNLIKLGTAFKLLIPFKAKSILSAERQVKSFHSTKTIKVQLSPEQKHAVSTMSNFANGFKPILLHGITGSGKTEVFLEFIRNLINNEKASTSNSNQVLLLVPEISLSNELAKNVASRIGGEVFIWHNTISQSKKLAVWKKAINGDSMVVVGARSALFIPFKNLKVIVIDEEHDTSFKQNEVAIYNGRDMAVYLGFCLNIPVILSSATPSIESYNNVVSGKYEYIKLTTRYHENATLPTVHIDDLRKNNTGTTLSQLSISEIEDCLKAKKQALIFVNRRGHTPKVLCRACGWKMMCPGCSAWLCYHHLSKTMVCHYCGYRTNVKNTCENCGSTELVGIGSGVEKVSEECSVLFPNAKILVLSSDTINTPNKISSAMQSIKNNEVDIIVGTQVVAKGHNFDNLNLVVVTCADAMLYGEDFRATERTFQLIYQVSGRAGRTGTSKAKVILQTYNPDDKLMKIIQENDIDKLYAMELHNRKLMGMPPYGKISSVILSSLSEKNLNEFAKELRHNAPSAKGIKVMGPIQPTIYKLRSRYRLRFLITSSRPLQQYLRNWIFSHKIPSNIRVTLDIDPYDFA